MSKVNSGRVYADKIEYPDGVSCCVWTPLGDDPDDESPGLCFDFSGEDLDDMLIVMEKLKDVEPTKYVPDPKYEEYQEKLEKQKKTWRYKLHMMIEDIGIHITPFDWDFRTLLITRPVGVKGDQRVSKLCKGFQIGPVMITW